MNGCKSIFLLVLNNLHLFTYSKVNSGYHRHVNAVKYENYFLLEIHCGNRQDMCRQKFGYFSLCLVKGQRYNFGRWNAFVMCARYLMLMDCQEFDAFTFNQNRDDSESLHFRDFDRKKSLKTF